MRNKSLLFNIYFATLAVLMIAASILRSIALLNDMNYASGHFNDKIVIGIADKLIVAAVILALSYAFFAKRGKELIFDFSSPLNYIFSGTVGAAILLYSGYALSAGFRLKSILLIITGFLAILSTVHFILASVTTVVSSERRADFGIITVIFLALYAAYLYFDSSLPINSPIKIVDEMTYISAALFFLYETRISIGREKWPRYTALGFVTMLLTAYSSIPALITYFADGIIVSNNIFETVLSFAILLFVLARLALSASLKEKKESSTVSIIKAAADKRSAELEPIIPEEETQEAAEQESDREEPSDEYYELDFDGEGESEEATNEPETENEI